VDGPSDKHSNKPRKNLAAQKLKNQRPTKCVIRLMKTRSTTNRMTPKATGATGIPYRRDVSLAAQSYLRYTAGKYGIAFLPYPPVRCHWMCACRPAPLNYRGHYQPFCHYRRISHFVRAERLERMRIEARTTEPTWAEITILDTSVGS